MECKKMRMWMVNPKRMCRSHLLGEHCELHKLVGALNKGKDIVNSKYVTEGLVELHHIISRHATIVREMEERNMHHNSPLPSFPFCIAGKVDIQKSIDDLKSRCSECKV